MTDMIALAKELANLVTEYRLVLAVFFMIGWIQTNIRIDGLQKELKRNRLRDLPMPIDIDIVSSPRPEPGQEPPLPTYHELLNLLCDEFSVPGSHDFRGAIRYIKEHYPSPSKKFLDWFLSSQVSEPIPSVLDLVNHSALTPEGRLRIAQSYVEPTTQQIRRLIVNQDSLLNARRQARLIENLIQCYPEGERFSIPLMALRENLIELYSFMSPNYEATDEDTGEPTPERNQATARELQKEVEPYDGPRPTRFEHLFEEDKD